MKIAKVIWAAEAREETGRDPLDSSDIRPVKERLSIKITRTFHCFNQWGGDLGRFDVIRLKELGKWSFKVASHLNQEVDLDKFPSHVEAFCSSWKKVSYFIHLDLGCVVEDPIRELYGSGAVG